MMAELKEERFSFSRWKMKSLYDILGTLSTDTKACVKYRTDEVQDEEDYNQVFYRQD